MRWEDYYWKRVRKVKNSDCLVWIGPFNEEDRPVAYIDRRKISALGLSWAVDGGALADGPFVRTCRNPNCVNVDHIRRKSDYPMGDENAIDDRLEDGFRAMADDEDLSDCE